MSTRGLTELLVPCGKDQVIAPRGLFLPSLGRFLREPNQFIQDLLS
jgi:hypothetical protein